MNVQGHASPVAWFEFMGEAGRELSEFYSHLRGWTGSGTSSHSKLCVANEALDRSRPATRPDDLRWPRWRRAHDRLVPI
jgi:predicted enzyme related to lactoylglutathione lyase